jgi:hypothetical protein
MSHVHNEDREVGIADLVDHAIVADSDAPRLTAGEFLDAWRTWTRRKPANSGNDTVLGGWRN